MRNAWENVHLRIALDATYSVGSALSGVGVYCRQVLAGLPVMHRESHFTFCYRPHRFIRSFDEKLPSNCSRAMLFDRIMSPDCDLFHALNQRLPDRRPRRCVSTFHDLFVLTAEYSTPDFRDRFASQAKLAAERSDLIIAVSQFTAGQVRDLLGVENSRIRVVHHGVTGPQPGFQRKPENLVLHVGAIQQRKNIARLVAAFETLDTSWTLVLAGSSGYRADEILKKVRSSPAAARIQVTGYVEASALEQLYARASIFAFPSLDEGFGLPVLEAMARGVPVLTSNGSALREVAGDAALLVDATDANAIAKGLAVLASDSDLRENLAGKGRGRAGEFTWQAAMEKIWRVYTELVN